MSSVMGPFNTSSRATLKKGSKACKITAVATDIAMRGMDHKALKHQAAANCAGEDSAIKPDNQTADLALINQVKMGQKIAFDMLVLKYQHKVIKLISRYVYDQSEVLDITQETFIKVYRALPGFRGDSAFYTWLYRIAINTTKNHLLCRSRRPPAYDIDATDAEQYVAEGRLKDLQTPEQILLSDEVGRAVIQAVESLGDDLQVAIVLREIDGLSYEEIAVAMDCPIGTVRSRISRAREAIKSGLDRLS